MSARSTRISRRVPATPAKHICLALVAGVIAATWSAAPARAAVAMEPARVRVAAALIDDVIRGLLPVDLVLPGPLGGSVDGGISQTSLAAVLSELRYCGPTDKGVGRFRAVIRWGAAPGRASPILGGDDGCRQSLADLAKPSAVAGVADDSSGVSVADVEAAWRPWELRLVVVRAAGPSPPRPGPPRPLGALDSRKELLSLSTAGFRIPTDAGEVLTFHVAPSFATDGIEILALWGDKGSGPPLARPVASGPASGLSGDVNVAADLPYAFANQILRQMTGPQPLAIPIDRDVVDLQNAAVTGTSGGAMVTGFATPRSVRETARLTVQTGGAELRVASIRADAQLENCAALGMLAAMACNTRNAGRNAAAAAFGATMSNKYQGQLVRELAGPQEFRFDAAGRRLELRGALVRLGGGARGLSVGARFGAGTGDH